MRATRLGCDSSTADAIANMWIYYDLRMRILNLHFL